MEKEKEKIEGNIRRSLENAQHDERLSLILNRHYVVVAPAGHAALGRGPSVGPQSPGLLTAVGPSVVASRPDTAMNSIAGRQHYLSCGMTDCP